MPRRYASRNFARRQRVLNGGAARFDTLVLFGVTGDLVHKKILPALYAMAGRGMPKVPVVGVASAKWSMAQLHNGFGTED